LFAEIVCSRERAGFVGAGVSPVPQSNVFSAMYEVAVEGWLKSAEADIVMRGRPVCGNKAHNRAIVVRSVCAEGLRWLRLQAERFYKAL